MNEGPNDPERRSLPTPLPMPWEDASRPRLARLFGTLANAFAPVRGVPPLCTGTIAPAWSFAFWTALPAMLLWGVIPFTRTVTFGPGFEVVHKRAPGSLPLWLDVTQAAGIGLALSLAVQLAWALPFVSLLRAFADPRLPSAVVRIVGQRFVLYRGWLMPMGMLSVTLFLWCASQGAAEALGPLAFFLFQLLPLLLLLLGAQAAAATLGASFLGALGVALVPLIMQQVVAMTVNVYAVQLMAPSEAVEAPAK